MSDEMPNTIWIASRYPYGENPIAAFKQSYSCDTHFTSTDWLRSQIEVAKVSAKEIDDCFHLGDDLKRIGDNRHNAALDQILTLLETGEKK